MAVPPELLLARETIFRRTFADRTKHLGRHFSYHYGYPRGSDRLFVSVSVGTRILIIFLIHH